MAHLEHFRSVCIPHFGHFIWWLLGPSTWALSSRYSLGSLGSTAAPGGDAFSLTGHGTRRFLSPARGRPIAQRRPGRCGVREPGAGGVSSPPVALCRATSRGREAMRQGDLARSAAGGPLPDVEVSDLTSEDAGRARRCLVGQGTSGCGGAACLNGTRHVLRNAQLRRRWGPGPRRVRLPGALADRR